MFASSKWNSNVITYTAESRQKFKLLTQINLNNNYHQPLIEQPSPKTRNIHNLVPRVRIPYSHSLEPGARKVGVRTQGRLLFNFGIILNDVYKTAIFLKIYRYSYMYRMVTNHGWLQWSLSISINSKTQEFLKHQDIVEAVWVINNTTLLFNTEAASNTSFKMLQEF